MLKVLLVRAPEGTKAADLQKAGGLNPAKLTRTPGLKAFGMPTWFVGIHADMEQEFRKALNLLGAYTVKTFAEEF